jgi:hypothetical protein
VREDRAKAVAIATDLITEERDAIRDTSIPNAVADAIEDAVLVTCRGRAAVPRNGYGRREIEDVPTIEEPPGSSGRRTSSPAACTHSATTTRPSTR